MSSSSHVLNIPISMPVKKRTITGSGQKKTVFTQQTFSDVSQSSTEKTDRVSSNFAAPRVQRLLCTQDAMVTGSNQHGRELEPTVTSRTPQASFRELTQVFELLYATHELLY